MCVVDKNILRPHGDRVHATQINLTEKKTNLLQWDENCIGRVLDKQQEHFLCIHYKSKCKSEIDKNVSWIAISFISNSLVKKYRKRKCDNIQRKQ